MDRRRAPLLFASVVAVAGIAFFGIRWRSGRSLGRALDLAAEGVKLETQGDIRGAAEKYGQALLVHQDFPYGLVLSGGVHHRLGEDEKALEEFSHALRLSPHHFLAQYSMAKLLKDQGRYAEAAQKFQELIAMKDNWYHSNSTLGYTDYQRHAFKDLGDCYGQLGDKRKAREAYERFLASGPAGADKEIAERLARELKAE